MAPTRHFRLCRLPWGSPVTGGWGGWHRAVTPGCPSACPENPPTPVKADREGLPGPQGGAQFSPSSQQHSTGLACDGNSRRSPATRPAARVHAGPEPESSQGRRAAARPLALAEWRKSPLWTSNATRVRGNLDTYPGPPLPSGTWQVLGTGPMPSLPAPNPCVSPCICAHHVWAWECTPADGWPATSPRDSDRHFL